MSGGILSGGILAGGILSRGDFGWGDFVRGDFVRGDFVRGDFVRGDFVLEPKQTYGHIEPGPFGDRGTVIGSDRSEMKSNNILHCILYKSLFYYKTSNSIYQIPCSVQADQQNKHQLQRPIYVHLTAVNIEDCRNVGDEREIRYVRKLAFISFVESYIQTYNTKSTALNTDLRQRHTSVCATEKTALKPIFHWKLGLRWAPNASDTTCWYFLR